MFIFGNLSNLWYYFPSAWRIFFGIFFNASLIWKTDFLLYEMYLLHLHFEIFILGVCVCNYGLFLFVWAFGFGVLFVWFLHFKYDVPINSSLQCSWEAVPGLRHSFLPVFNGLFLSLAAFRVTYFGLQQFYCDVSMCDFLHIYCIYI